MSENGTSLHKKNTGIPLPPQKKSLACVSCGLRCRRALSDVVWKCRCARVWCGRRAERECWSVGVGVGLHSALGELLVSNGKYFVNCV